MKSIFKSVLLAGLLATAGFAAFAQVPASADCGGMVGAGGPMHEGLRRHRIGDRDPARRQAWMDKRHAELKTQLKLTPAQEGAWTAYTAAMKPPADLIAKRFAERLELDKLSTPERIDKMKVLRTQHMNDMNAAMDTRGDATKAFYATLTPEQQKVYDASALRRHGADGRKGRWWDSKGPVQPKPQPANPAAK
jgi:protein CpxP